MPQLEFLEPAAQFGVSIMHKGDRATPATVPVVATFHASLDRSRLMETVSPVLRTISRRIA